MRKIVSTIILLMLGILPAYSYGDFARLVAEAVLVERDPIQPTPAAGSDPYAPVPSNIPIGAAANASYKTTGGWAIASKTYIDAAAMVFDFSATKSVSKATLNLPIQQIHTLNGAAHLRIYVFADNGVIDHTDYRVGFPTAIAFVNAAGMNKITLDVTGFVNSTLKTSRFVGFRVVPAFNIGSIPDVTFPSYKGVKFNPAAYSLEFTAGAAPIPGPNVAAFDGLTMVVPDIFVAGTGTAYARLQLNDINNGIFDLTYVEVTNPVAVPAGAPSFVGMNLLNCDAFSPPVQAPVLTPERPTYVNGSGVLTVPKLDYLGMPYSTSMQLKFNSPPAQFSIKSFASFIARIPVASTSALNGGLTIQPTQDFIPLCHGWVLIGDTFGNRLVERNIISGETAGSYPLNTTPNQLALDEVNARVFFSVHPESQRLYKLNLLDGVITSHKIYDPSNGYRFVPRDFALGENGVIFAILFDALHPGPPPRPTPDTKGLWLGVLDSNAVPLVPSQHMAEPIRIEYDPIFQRVFLTTQSNLATFNYNSNTHALSFVPGTDVPVGNRCTDFSISPDATRLAYTCPNGNETAIHFSIHDLNPVNYYDPYGEWLLGTSPVSATFNRTGDLLIATDGIKLFFFDVITHKQLGLFDMGLGANEKVKRIRVSKDGNLVLVFMENSLDASSGKMYWMKMPPITGTPIP